jgi:hypothetical protein
MKKRFSALKYDPVNYDRHPSAAGGFCEHNLI